MLSSGVIQLLDNFGPLFAVLNNVPQNFKIFIRLPLLFFNTVVQMVLPPLSALFRGLERFSLCLEKYFLCNLIPVIIFNMPFNYKLLITSHKLSGFNPHSMSINDVYDFSGWPEIDISEIKYPY